nr:hypothetical protein CFP56_56309 [Quercus suber]
MVSNTLIAGLVHEEKLSHGQETRIQVQSIVACLDWYAQVSIVQQAGQINCRKVPRLVCPVAEGCGCC